MRQTISMDEFLDADDFADNRSASAKPKEKNDKNPFYQQDLAKKFLEENGHPVCTYQGNHLVYDDGRYREEKHLPMKLRQLLLRNKVPHNNTLVGNVIPHIEAMTFLDGQDHPSLPFWRGKEYAKPQNVIAYRNGLADVERILDGDHTLLPHTPEWVSLIRLPFDYDPGATCPKWLSFLEETLEGDQDRIRLLQEFMGYGLLPDPTRQKLLVLKGLPRSGKGTVARVFGRLLGDENSTGFSLTALAERFGIGSLVGKLAAFVGEVNLQKCNDKYTILERLNSIVGCDPVEVEYKHNPHKSSVILPVRFVISCNEFPNFADTSGALASRLLLVDFEKSVPEEERDPGLTEKLCTELPGINNWALKGLERLNEHGFTMPAKTKDSIQRIRRESSSTYAFLQDCLIINKELDTGNLPGIATTTDEVSTTADDLKSSFMSWANDNDTRDSAEWLGRNLRTLLPKLDRKKVKLGDGRVWGYPGIAIQPGMKGKTILNTWGDKKS